MTIRLLASRGYSRAELLLAMLELPFDPKASHNFGRGLNLADVERIVSENRAFRRSVSGKMTSEQRDALIRSNEDLDPDAFHCCGFDKYNNPLWRYAPDLPKPKAAPVPTLEESPRSTGTRSGYAVSLSDALNQDGEAA